MTGLAPTLLQPFFKGNSLASELGFVHHYHFHRANRLLHTLAIPLLIFGLLTVCYSIDYRLALLFYTLYCTVVLLFDYKTALAYVVLFGALFYSASVFTPRSTTPALTGSAVFFFGLILQGLGHFVFERSSPAFRLFEAVFTTPVFLMLYLITDKNEPLWANIQEETRQWKRILHK